MGNNNLGSIRFSQSVNDFPLLVTLGDKLPSWGLSRWKEENSLSFIPLDDEGFSMRGNKKQLLYKGRKRSHRFTILGDGAFEYDCILEKEPESNVVTLLMDGAERYDFFRQPDFVHDDFLKGSYAVYKKETLIGQGTGKLCHIHKPLIIDARGRKVWGELSVIDNELRITIPQDWLANAKYPVVVDPTIGSTQLGSLTHWDNVDNESYDPLHIEVSIAVNRFLIPETFEGLATAYIYAYNNDYEPPVRPVIYSDNNNSPLTRRSANEGFFDIEVRSGKPASWRSATFQTNTSIASGSNLWFGLCSWWYATRFDFGAKSYFGDWSNNTVIPNTFPLYNVNWFSDFKFTMYFTYTSAQNYVRTLTQGIRLTDARSIKTDYKRVTEQNVLGSDNNRSSFLFLRECFSNVISNISLSRTSSIIRTITENHGLTDTFKRINEYFYNLYEVAGSIAETKRYGDYFRAKNDTVHAVGSVFRHLLVFIKLLSTSLVRDFILRRFLIAREEIVLKSCITRELTLESKIN